MIKVFMYFKDNCYSVPICIRIQMGRAIRYNLFVLLSQKGLPLLSLTQKIE